MFEAYNKMHHLGWLGPYPWIQDKSKKIIRSKHCSLFSWTLSDEEKMLDIIRTKCQWYKTFFYDREPNEKFARPLISDNFLQNCLEYVHLAKYLLYLRHTIKLGCLCPFAQILDKSENMNTDKYNNLFFHTVSDGKNVG